MYNYLPNDFYRNNQNEMYNLKNANNLTILQPSEGYTRGNLFNDLYNQYKNYKPIPIEINNEQEKLLNDLSEMSFAAHELNLYLDVNPNDTSIITLFNDYRQRYLEAQEEYEKKYGPLTTRSNNIEQTPFLWEECAWPWEEKYNVQLY